MTFHVPPENQGQIVEVSYAVTPAGVIARTMDRSDGEVKYAIHKWTRALDEWDDPWNTPPPVARGWRPISEREVDAIAADM